MYPHIFNKSIKQEIKMAGNSRYFNANLLLPATGNGVFFAYLTISFKIDLWLPKCISTRYSPFCSPMSRIES